MPKKKWIKCKYASRPFGTGKDERRLCYLLDAIKEPGEKHEVYHRHKSQCQLCVIPEKDNVLEQIKSVVSQFHRDTCPKGRMGVYDRLRQELDGVSWDTVIGAELVAGMILAILDQHEQKSKECQSEISGR